MWTAAALVMGGMIGSGIFVMPGQLAPFGWTGLIAWAVVIPGVLVLAKVIASLIAVRPQSAGAGAIIGDALGPLAGVLVNWSYWVSVWSANAVLAQTAIRYMAVFEPRLAASDAALGLWSIVLIWAMTLLNLRGPTAAGRFQLVTTALRILPLLAVMLIGAQLLGRGESGAVAALKPFSGSDFTMVMAIAFYAMVGFETAGVAAERVRDPARNVARATLIGVALTGLLYVAVCAAILLALPGADVAAAPAPIALFVERFWGAGAAQLLAAFAIIAVVGCLNCWVLIQGEHPLSMARAGLLPAKFAATNRHDVPVPAVLLGSGCTTVLLLSSVSADGGLLTFMLNLTAAASLSFYLGCCLAALALRVAPLWAGLGTAFGLWALYGSGRGALLSLALMGAVLPLYWWTQRQKRAAT